MLSGALRRCRKCHCYVTNSHARRSWIRHWQYCANIVSKRFSSLSKADFQEGQCLWEGFWARSHRPPTHSLCASTATSTATAIDSSSLAAQIFDGRLSDLPSLPAKLDHGVSLGFFETFSLSGQPCQALLLAHAIIACSMCCHWGITWCHGNAQRR